jgi:phosphate transport system protein
MEMIKETEDEDKLNELAARINVEYSKTDDIYSMIEKDLLNKMHTEHKVNEEYINLMKYIRKNLKIIDRLEDIVSRLMFARIGGKL